MSVIVYADRTQQFPFLSQPYSLLKNIEKQFPMEHEAVSVDIDLQLVLAHYAHRTCDNLC